MRIPLLFLGLALVLGAFLLTTGPLDSLTGHAQAAAGDPCKRPADDDDGDGLLNGWECGSVRFPEGRLNLATLGANPKHKDIFVQCAYMKKPGKNLQPPQAALDRVADAFAKAPLTNPDHKAGVTIHIDAGSVGVNTPAGAAGHMGKPVRYVEDWSDDPFSSGQFDKVKRATFPAVRKHAYHFCVFANNYAPNYSSGLSRGIPASDFMVTLGGAGWGPYPRPELEQQLAGTFMHELGHNLGLHHGGDGEDNYKPNYLSIMNYGYQLGGLLRGGKAGPIDYARFKAGSLNERKLVEKDGIAGPPAIKNYGALWSCPDGSYGLFSVAVDFKVSDGVDWNCDGKVRGTDSQSINNPSYFSDGGFKSTLTGFNDWAHIVFNGGEVGSGVRAQSVTDPRALREIGPAEAERIAAALREHGLLP